MFKLLITLFVFSQWKLVLGESYRVQNGTELINLLCNKGDLLKNRDVTILLDANVTYLIEQKANPVGKNICIIATSGALTLRSSSSVLSAVIKCSDGFRYGFLFQNMAITIMNIDVTNCGRHPTGVRLTSKFHFTDNHGASLAFLNTIIALTNVSVTSYYGFAIVAINPQYFNSDNLRIQDTARLTRNSSEVIYGCGVLIVYETVKASASVGIRNSVFSRNINHQTNDVYVHSTFTNLKTPISINAAGLTIVLAHTTNHVFISIEHVTVSRNEGYSTSGMLVVMLPESEGNVSISNNSSFLQNVGGDLAFVLNFCKGKSKKAATVPLTISETSFEKGSNAVFIGITRLVCHYYVTILMERVKFSNYYGNISGVCVSVIVEGLYKNPNVHFDMFGVNATNNSLSFNSRMILGVFSFRNIGKVIIGGNETFPSTFTHNQGSVIKGVCSEVYLTGTIVFKQNWSIKGGALHIYDNTLHFDSQARIDFINNLAEVNGGAILLTMDIFADNPRCAFDFIKNNGSTALIQMVGNVALTSGNAVYAYPIYNCSNQSNHSMDYYTQRFNIMHTDGFNNTLLDVSTLPVSIKVQSPPHNQTYHAGQTITIPVAVVDGSSSGNYVFAAVRFFVMDDHTNFSISSDEQTQRVHESSNRESSLLKLTAHLSKDVMETTVVKIGMFVLHSPKTTTSVISVRIGKCPFGFVLNEIEAKRTCDCHPLLHRVAKDSTPIRCDIQSSLILSSAFLWIGLDSKSNGSFSAATNCKVEHCNMLKYTGNLTVINGNSLANVYISSRDKGLVPMCKKNRVGVLCGKCREGFSAVFGSSMCKKCNNYWIGIFLVIMMSFGAFAVFVLYTLNLTLAAGTINGILFSAQLFEVTIAPSFRALFEKNSVFFEAILIIISSLNLTIKVPLCFYDGMDEVWKTAIAFLNPLYLLTLVFIIVVCSRYSSWLSNKTSHLSVQVLITIIHLSFTMMLTSLIEILRWAKLYIEGRGIVHVWLIDGSLEYGRDLRHILLMVFGSSMITAFVLPYLALLFCGRYCINRYSKANKYLRPFYEAIHAPYKEKHCRWFAARLVLSMVLYLEGIMFSRGYYNGLDCVLLTLFTIAQAYIKPFKTKLLNVLDTSVMVLSIIVCFCFSFFLFINKSIDLKQYQLVIFGVLFVILILIVVFVISYHFMVVTGHLPKLKCLVMKLNALRCCPKSKAASTDVTFSSDAMKCDQAIHYSREPLLDD